MATKPRSAGKPDKKNNSQQNDLSNLAEAIISNAGVGIYIIQRGKFVYVSQLCQKLTGYADTELIGKYPIDSIHPDDREMVREKAIKCLKGERFEPYEYRFLKKNNEIIWVLETITPVVYKGERATLGSFMDISERKQSENALRISEEKYRSIIENMQEPYYETDLEGNFTFFNEALCKHLGYSAEELIGRNINRENTDKEAAKKIYQAYNRIYRTGEPIKGIEETYTRKDGIKGFAELSVSLIRDTEGKPIGFRGFSYDITERKQAEETIRQSEERYRTIIESIEDGYVEVDLTGQWTFVNDVICEHMKYSRQELIGMDFHKLHTERSAKKSVKAFTEVYLTGKPLKSIEIEGVRKDGTVGNYELSVSLMKDAKEQPIGFRCISRDITERKKMEEQIKYLATHDTLTGLPNRLMFSQLLNHAIQSAQRNNRQLAVFFIDLDRFKAINDSLGHEAGDQLLQELARRFQQSLRAVDVVGRLGGDEFVILIEELNVLSNAAIVARKILAAAIKPVILLGEECRVTASIGISVYPKDGEDEQTLMKNADMAMYYAKEEGKNNYQFYSKDLQSQAIERLSIETNLRLALERKEFFLHYQAKLAFKTGMITGVEALLRWNNPYLGLVTPTQFIPVAEETGLIVAIGKWVIKTACAQNVAWQRQGLPPVCMAVNLSLRQLMDENLLDDIKSALRDSGMAPNLLELEITESMIMHNSSRLMVMLTEIKEMGVRLALDDFGTGYSSLAQIRRFPIDTLKVDRSFIRNIPQDSEDNAITKAIISMGKTLSLTVVAEGVETQEQEDFLREHICDEMQGFYFSKPIMPDQFGELLRKHEPFFQK